jgi:uncharacterized protein YqeY
MSQPWAEEDPAGDVRAAVRRALAEAMRARDPVAASALRSALGAIGNAEAVAVPRAPVSRASSASSPHIAGAAAGLGAGEAERRRLTEEDARAILRAETEERLAAAADYERAGRGDRAARLRHEADVLRRLI